MLQIAIGRRIFDTVDVLSDEKWSSFQDAVETAVRDTMWISPNTKALGVSEFNGLAEETCLFVWFNADSIGADTKYLLAELATEFSQFEIAVTVGNTEFVEGV